MHRELGRSIRKDRNLGPFNFTWSARYGLYSRARRDGWRLEACPNACDMSRYRVASRIVGPEVMKRTLGNSWSNVAHSQRYPLYWAFNRPIPYSVKTSSMSLDSGVYNRGNYTPAVYKLLAQIIARNHPPCLSAPASCGEPREGNSAPVPVRPTRRRRIKHRIVVYRSTCSVTTFALHPGRSRRDLTECN